MFFFSQNHARKEDFSWEFSDCERCKFLCRRLRISWKIDEVWTCGCVFFGRGGGENITCPEILAEDLLWKFQVTSFLGATPVSRLASINMLDTFNIEYQQYAWTRLDKLTGCQ